MTNIEQLLQGMADRLAAGANVVKVYGTPIEAHGRIVVPVAKVAYGFGAFHSPRLQTQAAGGRGRWCADWGVGCPAYGALATEEPSRERMSSRPAAAPERLSVVCRL
jgi:hypothetical protein